VTYFVIGASEGGIGTLKTLVAPLPATLPVSIFLVLHIGRHNSNLDWILSAAGSLRVSQARHGEAINDNAFTSRLRIITCTYGKTGYDSTKVPKNTSHAPPLIHCFGLQRKAMGRGWSESF
jgi:hypothetical protein